MNLAYCVILCDGEDCAVEELSFYHVSSTGM